MVVGGLAGICIEVGLAPADAADAAVDVGIQHGEEAVGTILKEHLDAGGIGIVVAQDDGIADQADRRFIELAVQGNGAILVDLAARDGAEVVTQIVWRRTQQLQVTQVALQWPLAGSGVDALVVGAVEPVGEPGIELVEGVVVTDQGQQLSAHGQEVALDFAFSLRGMRGREQQRYAERRASEGQSLGAKRRAIVDKMPNSAFCDYPEEKQMPKFDGNLLPHKQIALQTSA